MREKERERERERKRQRHRQKEKQAPYRQPDVGLDPASPGSHPRPKAGTKPPSHPGIPSLILLELPHLENCRNLKMAKRFFLNVIQIFQYTLY